jgi:hypothetical protein
VHFSLPSKFFAAVLSTFILAPAMAYEEPKNRVVETVGAIQIREYAPSIVAEVEVDGDRSEAANKGFRALAGYIFGGNKSVQKIAMTAPVTPTAQTTSADGAQRWRVTFTMPSQYTLENLPKPDNAAVKLTIQPGEKRATIRFSGFSTVDNLAKHRAQHEAFVAERKLETKGAYTVAYYDDPFTLPWNRRNEWWVAIQ